MKNKICLEEGEIICSKCNGKRNYPFNNDVVIWCSKCQGTGKLDWVSNAMGDFKWWNARNYHGAVKIDSVKGVSGTTYPIGTPTSPVNNIKDALVIAKERGFI